MCIPSGGSDTSHRIRNDITDFQGATSVIVAVENGKDCKQTTMRKRLEGFGGVLIVFNTNGLRLDYVEKTKRIIRSTTPDTGVVL